MRRAALLAISGGLCCIAIAVAQSTAVFFAPRVDFPVGNLPYGIITADFNKDGNPDLATSNNESHDVSVLLGGGDGSFVAVGPFGVDDTGSSFPSALASGDLNEDTNPDLVVTNELVETEVFGTISVLLGNGNGTFGTPRTTTVGTSPEGVVVADLDGDDNLDAACTNFFDEPGTISILLGNGDGTFDPPTSVEVDGGPFGIAAGRIDGDTDIDLAITASDIGMVVVLLNNGNATFAPGRSFEVGLTPIGILVQDLDADGDADIAAADEDNDQVYVLLGDGAGNFADAVPYLTGSFPEAVVAGDFNDDDVIDLATADAFGTELLNNSVTVLVGNGNGTFGAPQSFETDEGPFALTTADFDKDGLADLATANSDGNNVSLLINVSDAPPPATPTPTGPVSTPTPTGPPGTCLGDCDDSGDVRVNELLIGVNIALDQAELAACPAFDRDGSGEVEVSELVGGVNNALGSCG